MKNPIEMEELFKDLNNPDSHMKTLWTEHQIKEWTRKLGGLSEDFTLYRFAASYGLHWVCPYVVHTDVCITLA